MSDSEWAYPKDGYTHLGLTKRELFAALAMQKLIGDSDITETLMLANLTPEKMARVIANGACMYADALIAALAAKDAGSDPQRGPA